MTRARAAHGALALALGLTLAACGERDGTAGEAGTESAPALDWAAADDPVATDALAWASSDGVIHLGEDAAAYDAGEPIASYVVAGDGAYAVAEGSSELLLVSADRVEATGAHAQPDSLRASPDGRFLAFLDPEVGEPDEYGTPQAVAVVVDLSDGTEVLRSAEGMGDPASDDLADLYEDAEPGVLGLTDAAAYVHTTSEVLTVDLARGEVTDRTDSSPFDSAQPWYAPRTDTDGLWNSDRSWSIEEAEPRDRFVSADGDRLDPAPETPTWSLSRWLDQQTAVGFAVDAPPDEGYLDTEAPRTLITCTVPDGACTSVPNASGPPGAVLLPARNLL